MARLLSDAVSAFTSNGVPVAHVRAHVGTPPPYAESHLNDSRYFYSDDRASRLFCEYEFVLYCKERDLALEGLIEDALDSHEITLESKSTGHVADEDLVTTTYRFEVFER